MEIAQILEVSTDFLLFGEKMREQDNFQYFLKGKNDREKEYLDKILQVAAENLKMGMMKDDKKIVKCSEIGDRFKFCVN